MSALPQEFLENIQKMLGAEAPAFFAALDEAPTLALRVNPLKSGAKEAARAFCGTPVPWAAGGYYLQENTRPGLAPAHAAGAYYLQEASAMLSAAALDAQPGERVLDLCAAPGGKATQLAGALGGEGLLVANEPEPTRARMLAGNLERWGAHNAVVVNAYPDALSARWPGFFDAVLVDAPCSGEGMFRREPDARGEWNAAAPAGCAKRQANILDAAARLVRPGGRIVYSTCTFNRAENEDGIAAFLDRHPDFTPEDFRLPGLPPSQNGALRIWPQRVSGDGHFAARLRRAGETPPANIPAIPPADREAEALIKTLAQEVCQLPEWLQSARKLIWRDWLFAVPTLCPDTAGVRVVSPGVCLLRIGRGHIEPAHALALTLNPGEARQCADLSSEQAQTYLRGETIDLPGPRGWLLCCENHLPLGWGKRSEDTIKNHYPKGLRR